MAATPRFSAAGPLACGCLLAAGSALVTVLDPAQTPLFLPCPWRTVTGLWCPACGLTRATHHLLRGDVATALRYNALVVPVLAAIALSWLAWLRATVTTGSLRSRPVSTVWVSAAGAAALCFAIVRNLPGLHGLRG
jgi:hypothetical protein